MDGNLEITWLEEKQIDLSFLHHIREVTGYVLIFHADVEKIPLPNLLVIRGRTLFELNNRNDSFALLVVQSKINNLEMPELRGKNAL